MSKKKSGKKKNEVTCWAIIIPTTECLSRTHTKEKSDKFFELVKTDSFVGVHPNGMWQVLIYRDIQDRNKAFMNLYEYTEHKTKAKVVANACYVPKESIEECVTSRYS